MPGPKSHMIVEIQPAHLESWSFNSFRQDLKKQYNCKKFNYSKSPGFKGRERYEVPEKWPKSFETLDKRIHGHSGTSSEEPHLRKIRRDE